MYRGSCTRRAAALSGRDLGGILQHIVNGNDSCALPSGRGSGGSGGGGGGGGGGFALTRVCHKDGRAWFCGARGRRWAAGTGDGHCRSVVRECLINDASRGTCAYSRYLQVGSVVRMLYVQTRIDTYVRYM